MRLCVDLRHLYLRVAALILVCAFSKLFGDVPVAQSYNWNEFNWTAYNATTFNWTAWEEEPKIPPLGVIASNWSAMNKPTANLYDNNVFYSLSNSSLFRAIFAAPNNSFIFGFLDHLDGFSTLAIAANPSGFWDSHAGDGHLMKSHDYLVVWRANRNSPVGVNAVLKLSRGNLVLYDNDTREVWSTNLPPGTSITGIEMCSTGNLVLTDGDNRRVWQSIDYPTDTLLLGANLTLNMSLVADSSPTNGSEGSYKMVMEAQGLVLYTTLGASPIPQPYWTETLLPGTNINLFHKIRSGLITLYSFIKYDHYSECNVLYVCALPGPFTTPLIILNCGQDVFGPSGIVESVRSFLKLDPDGVLLWYVPGRNPTGVWETLKIRSRDSDPCLQLPAQCGPYGICFNGGACRCPEGEVGLSPFQLRNSSDYSKGCFPTWNNRHCVHGNPVHPDIDMLELHNVSYVPNKYQFPTAQNVTADECKNMCLINCSCAASFFQEYHFDIRLWSELNKYNETLWRTTACFLVADLLTMYTTSHQRGQNLAFIKHIRQARPKRGGAWKLGVGISIGVVLVIIALVGVVRRFRMTAEDGDEEEQEAFLGSLPGLPPRFSYKDLYHATKHFSKILGQGGFGTVYEGFLADGSKVAVKRLGGSKQGQKEFRAEVATIGGINHLRLVRLWGFCSEGAHRLLVYECMNNGSLDRWLFHDEVLDWAVRYQIAVDTAQGLCYLHRDCRRKIIHLDVKPQNILLDDHFRAKVADFGMSKLFDRELTKVVTRMRGTPGYLAPEWLLQTGISEKCDVYSYGMVLLEIVSGRKNIDVNESPEKLYCPTWAVQRMQAQSWKDILDVRLEEFSLTGEEWEQVKKVLMIAMWCIQDKPRMRPSMAKVLQMLEGVVEVDDPPLQYDFLSLEGDLDGPHAISVPSFISSGISSAIQDEQFCSPKLGVMGSFLQARFQLKFFSKISRLKSFLKSLITLFISSHHGHCTCEPID